jgi:hypothetical protein
MWRMQVQRLRNADYTGLSADLWVPLPEERMPLYRRLMAALRRVSELNDREKAIGHRVIHLMLLEFDPID